MTYVLLSPDLVVKIHDSALNPGELAGMALDKSLEGALARVDNRLVYGMIEDVFDLAAAYCVAVATGHVFNDANKRTAHLVLDICLDLNGVQLDHETIRGKTAAQDKPAIAPGARGCQNGPHPQTKSRPA